MNKQLTFLLALTFLFLFSGSVYGDDFKDFYDRFFKKDGPREGMGLPENDKEIPRKKFNQFFRREIQVDRCSWFWQVKLVL